MDVVLGDHNRWWLDGNEQVISASHVIPHPNYESWIVNNDIMLIKLSQPATLNQYIQPVALPTGCAPAGTMCTVSGWGVTMSSGGYTAALHWGTSGDGTKYLIINNGVPSQPVGELEPLCCGLWGSNRSTLGWEWNTLTNHNTILPLC